MKKSLSGLLAAAILAPLTVQAEEVPGTTQLQQQIDALAEQIEQLGGTPPSQSTTIGGYGEMHYNLLNNQLAGGSDKKSIDFHRFVLFIGHEFAPDTRFFSELEVEHSVAADGEAGAVELEQAYVEFDLSPQTTAKSGLFLLPIGITNETHEPPTFYGVERNPVEKNIIPTTWWEGGAAIGQRFANGLSYDLALHSGLYHSGYNLRSGRQKVSEAKGDALAYTGRIKWTGVPGLELAASLNHQDDIRQDTGTRKVSANLLETHAIYNSGPFGLRALYAQWQLDDDGTAAGADEQYGWYVEPAYRINSRWGVFARHNIWDNQSGDSTDSEYQQTDIGVNFWPHPDVVIKLDYQDQSVPTGQNEYDGINLGIGYQF